MTRLYEGGEGAADLQVQVDGVTLPDVREDDLGVLRVCHRVGSLGQPRDLNWGTGLLLLSPFKWIVVGSVLQSLDNLTAGGEGDLDNDDDAQDFQKNKTDK